MLRKEKEEAQQRKFIENLKQLHINLPFIEALAQMPKYAKFLKGLLTSKARLKEACTVTMNKRCSVVLLNKLPSKEKDPGSFTIPCDIGHLHINNALADLGARTNGVKSEHLYSANANKIDEKKPELKDLPHHLEYAYLHGNQSFPIIISSKLSEKEKKLLLQVLEKRKGAISWKMSDIKGISPSFCTHKILMEDDFKPCHSTPKAFKSKRFFEILITPKDQEKTMFTCPYGTFAYRRMPFGLCNAPTTFQRYMMVIFNDMVKDFMEVFMDDFLVFGNSFNRCLANLDRMLVRCEETNLVLNWEKCHFMVKEGIVLGHKTSGTRIKVDRAKID
ncbi:reverse transcriptase domain-containing protein, partial [Tanacetum coccineum]